MRGRNIFRMKRVSPLGDEAIDIYLLSFLLSDISRGRGNN